MTARRRRRGALGGLLAVGIGIVTGVARGDSKEDEAARLFEEGKVLMDQARYADACPKLARSQAIDPQVGTTLNLAYCYENLGKTASSWSLWLDAASAAEARGQTERQEFARQRAAQIQQRLLRLTITVAAQPELAKIEVQLDGSPVPKARWGAPTPVDPGDHWVQAIAPGRRPWLIQLQVDDQHVPLVSVPPLDVLLEERSAAIPTGGAPRRQSALVMGSAGILAIAAGSFLAFSAKATYDRAQCAPNNTCALSGERDRSNAYREAGIATAVIGGGVSALAGAAVLWLSSRSTTLRIEPTVGRADVGLSLQRAW